jgi:hypothetical protein
MVIAIAIIIAFYYRNYLIIKIVVIAAFYYMEHLIIKTKLPTTTFTLIHFNMLFFRLFSKRVPLVMTQYVWF